MRVDYRDGVVHEKNETNIVTVNEKILSSLASQLAKLAAVPKQIANISCS
jgi:hypothetical protein